MNNLVVQSKPEIIDMVLEVAIANLKKQAASFKFQRLFGDHIAPNMWEGELVIKEHIEEIMVTKKMFSPRAGEVCVRSTLITDFEVIYTEMRENKLLTFRKFSYTALKLDLVNALTVIDRNVKQAGAELVYLDLRKQFAQLKHASV